MILNEEDETGFHQILQETWQTPKISRSTVCHKKYLNLKPFKIELIKNLTKGNTLTRVSKPKKSLAKRRIKKLSETWFIKHKTCHSNPKSHKKDFALNAKVILVV